MVCNGDRLGNNIDRGKIEVGYYDRPERLTAAINRTLKEESDEKNVKLSYSKITQKVSVDLDIGTIFSMDMSNILVFNNSFVTTARQADSVVDMAQGFYALYVYTNLVEPRVVGDSVGPLLRIVPLEGKHGGMVSKSFDNVQYVPVLHKEFGTVEIDIRDDAGRSVPFFENARKRLPTLRLEGFPFSQNVVYEVNHVSPRDCRVFVHQLTAVIPLHPGHARHFFQKALCFFLHGFRHTIHDIFFYRDFLFWHCVRFILNHHVVCTRLFCDHNTHWFLPPFIGQIVVMTQNVIVQCYLFSLLQVASV